MSQLRQLRLNINEPSEAPVFDMPARTDRERRTAIGQFLTPKPVADFMASLFDTRSRNVELLDAGAGAGGLTSAFVRRTCQARDNTERINVTAYESDTEILNKLHATLEDCQRQCQAAGIEFTANILNEDFIAATVPHLQVKTLASTVARFNAAIVNPPYLKIQSSSITRKLLKSVGIETSNLYSAFVALITRLLLPGGQLVAITPRSFCNGPYYKPFRQDLLTRMSLRRLHVFESRSAVFAKDSVLQENVVFHAVKGKKSPQQVVISISQGDPNSMLLARGVSYSDVVSPSDPEQYIRLETDDSHKAARTAMGRWKSSLADLGVAVSTGRVVDFRAQEFLRAMPEKDTVPLIYPCHFTEGRICWPKTASRKPNAIINHPETRSLLVPSGVYVLIKRFSAKEERRRVVACLFDPVDVSSLYVGFENHLNYFHANGQGIEENFGRGLAAFLNSTIVDTHFREFSGHTQVNATDLRMLKYPVRAALENLGRRVADLGMSQDELDALIEQELL